MFRRWFACGALALLAFSPAPVAADEGGVSTTGETWEYRWGDSPRGPDGAFSWAEEPADSPGWERFAPLTIPPGRDGSTLLWVRIRLPAAPLRDPAVFLGSVANAFEAYAGGRRVYRHGVDDQGQPHFAPLAWHLVVLEPRDLGQPLYLRIHSSNTAIIGVQNALRVGNRVELMLRLVREGIGPLLVGFLSLALAMAAAAGFLVWRRQRGLGWFALFVGGAGMVLVSNGQVQKLLWDQPMAWNKLFSASVYLLPPSLWASSTPSSSPDATGPSRD